MFSGRRPKTASPASKPRVRGERPNSRSRMASADQRVAGRPYEEVLALTEVVHQIVAKLAEAEAPEEGR